jgi:hypothetical protein
MFAMRLEGNVAQHDDLVVAGNFLKSPAEVVARVLRIAGEPFFVGPHDPGRRAEHSRAFRIVAGPANERADGVFGLCA